MDWGGWWSDLDHHGAGPFRDFAGGQTELETQVDDGNNFTAQIDDALDASGNCGTCVGVRKRMISHPESPANRRIRARA